MLQKELGALVPNMAHSINTEIILQKVSGHGTNIEALFNFISTKVILQKDLGASLPKMVHSSNRALYSSITLSRSFLLF